jgi:hypothetical protein
MHMRPYPTSTHMLAFIPALLMLFGLLPLSTGAQGMAEHMSVRAVSAGSALAAGHALIQNHGNALKSMMNLSAQQVTRIRTCCNQLYKQASEKEKAGSLIEACRLYDQYLRIRLDSGISGPTDKPIEEVLCDLSSLYSKLGKPQSQKYAEDLLHIALILNGRQHGGPGDPSSVPILKRLGDSCLKQAKYKEAADYYDRSVRIIDKDSSSNKTASIPLRQNLGRAYKEAGEYNNAANTLQETISIIEHSTGNNSQKLLPVLESYSDVLTNLNRNEEAADIQRKVRLIRTLSGPADNASH